MSEASSNPVTQSEKQTLNFDLDTIREVAELLRESELGEICIETTGEDVAPARLLLRREASTPAAAPIYLATPAPAADSDAAPIETQSSDASTPATPTISVSSPAVGVFRPVKNPIQAGDAVKAGQAVAYVESMRVPHEVFSPVAGTVLERRAQDGQGIEYGQILFVIEETP